VHETLSKSADFTIYVRDRRPEAHFSTTNYVLPRTGQRGIPVISVNTKSVAVEIYRVGDRNLIDTIEGSRFSDGNFQKSLAPYEIDNLKSTGGVQVWQGELAVDNPPLNQEVTTAFPVDQAVGDLKPGGAAEGIKERRHRLRIDGDTMVHCFRSRNLGTVR
jgi:hypothetical protein